VRVPDGRDGSPHPGPFPEGEGISPLRFREGGQRARSVLVVGYGNPIRGDDGAGPYVARRVGELRPEVRAVEAHQLTPELAVDLAEVELAFFVDARADAPERGVEVTEVAASAGGTSSHHVTPGTLLAMARALFGRAPRAYAVSLPAYSFDFADDLTALARAAADGAVEEVVRRLDDRGGPGGAARR
jgi:hydrogenase maturation protease